MFEIGWTEMLVIAVVMIVVVGPKDLPRMLRTFGKTTAKLRSMAGDFQKQFNDALKEAELDDVKKSVDSLRGLNPAAEIRKQLNPFEKAAADVRAGLDAALKPAPEKPAEPTDHAAEPLKNGAAAMPEVAGPMEMPPAPVFPAMSADPASSVATAAEPLKNGAAALPGEGAAAAAKPAPGAPKSAPAATMKAEAKAKAKPTPKAKPPANAAAKAMPAAKTAAAKAPPAKPKAAPKSAAASKKTAGTAT